MLPGGIPANSQYRSLVSIGVATCLSALLESEGKALGVSNSVRITWPVGAQINRTHVQDRTDERWLAPTGVANAGIGSRSR